MDALDASWRADLSEEDRARVARWDALSVEAILIDGLEHEGLRKYAAFRIERRAPDRAAAEWLREEHEQGRVPGWEAAWLLGAIGHEAGYEPARAILVGAPEHAESHAGVALAMIRGAGAEADLITLMNESEKKATREGAARGLMHLETPSAAHAVFDAARSGRISIREAAAFAARFDSCHERVERALASTDIIEVSLAAELVFALIERAARADEPALHALRSYRERWRRGVHAAAASSRASLGPRRRSALLQWAG